MKYTTNKIPYEVHLSGLKPDTEKDRLFYS